MSEITTIAQTLGIKSPRVAAVVSLLDEGNTVPFIARYRKERTDNLNDEQVLHIAEQLKRVRALNERRATIIEQLREMERLTPELEEQLGAASSLTRLEDLYAPFKPKRTTRAAIARDQGLEPLAKLIVRQPVTDHPAEKFANHFVNDKVPTAAHAWTGARDIVAEMLTDHPDVRQALRRRAFDYGKLHARKKADAQDEKRTFELYYEYDQAVKLLRPHQVLAINRGEKEGVLSVNLSLTEHDVLLSVRRGFRPNADSPLKEQLDRALEDGFKRLLWPSIERDVRRQLTEKADEHAIGLFSNNLQHLLLQSPLAGKTILALDPGYRAGCKFAVTDPTGKVLTTGTVFPHKPQARYDDAQRQLLVAINRFGVDTIAIGNGTASRETEQMVAELTRELDGVHYLVVDESGASVYSASKVAREELPEMDVTLRGAVSIARRVQDPLAELVKVEPKSIGVGMYQHDVNQGDLSEALGNVVGLIVNRVGVEVNTASPSLLGYVAGIGPSLASKIVAHREENGPFTNRNQLKDVNGLGPKSFEQAAGFLRIRDSSNPLDASAIHPESYAIAKKLIKKANIDLEAMDSAEIKSALDQLLSDTPVDQLASELGSGAPTVEDICDQLVAPGRDLRDDVPTPLLRKDVLTADQLRPGLRLKGTVRNVIDFGAFVDIGVKRDGLLHRTQIPKDCDLYVGRIVEVEVRKVDNKRSRIDLGWPGSAPAAEQQHDS